MKLRHFLFAFLTVGRHQAWSLTPQDCADIKIPHLETYYNGCELGDGYAVAECTVDVARVAPTHAYSDHCIIGQYVHCPAISECFKGCAGQAIEEETRSCLSTVTKQLRLYVVDTTECDLDCANFDYSDAELLAEMVDNSEGTEGVDDDSLDDLVDAACGHLAPDMGSESCQYTDEEGAGIYQCLYDTGSNEKFAMEQQQLTSPTAAEYCAGLQGWFCKPLNCYPFGSECRQKSLEFHQCLMTWIWKEANAGTEFPDELDCDLTTLCDEPQQNEDIIASASGGQTTFAPVSAAATRSFKVLSAMIGLVLLPVL